MISITEVNLLSFIVDYFISIGIGEESSKSFFNSDTFDRALVLNLPTVCVVTQNKPVSSKSGETHIAITGQARSFLFSLEDVNSRTTSSEDIQMNVDISMANLRALGQVGEVKTFNSITTVNSFTYKKISYRKNQPNQVQIGKMKQDEENFLKLRKGLYTGDLLILLGYKERNHFYGIGIPADYYSACFSAPTSLYPKLINYSATITVNMVMEKIKDHYNDGVPLKDIDLVDDSIYQKSLIDAEPSQTGYIPVPKASKITSMVEQNKRNPQIGKEAIKVGGYKCGLNSGHATFVTKNGTPYVEAHHLIPMRKQDEFNNSLDVKANIIPLCSFCHDKIHYGTAEDINEMLEKLYEDRKELLELSGIGINFDKLKQYYKE